MSPPLGVGPNALLNQGLGVSPLAATSPNPIGPHTAPGPGVGSGMIRPAASSPNATVACPRCATPTPVGFAYCQGCGLHMQGMQPTDPAQLRPVLASAPAMGTPSPPQGGGTSPAARAHVDVQASTLAVEVRASAPQITPNAATGPAWGTAVLVNRDGSDGQRFPLAGEYAVVGRAGADIAFDDDRFLARHHARFERAADGSVRILPLDALNGVFRKAEAPVELVDGMIILVGREVLRYERVEPEEVKVHPLVRHGVALFGSPPREPWGRFVQILPSGGYRDVRHLFTDEVVLGREEGDIVYRDDAFMSRRHAAVTWNKQRAMITDLGSSNGTFVRLGGPTVIKHGDHVRMGDQLLRVELGK